MRYKSFVLRPMDALVIDDSPVSRNVQGEGLVIDDKTFPAVVITLRFGLQMVFLLARDKPLEFEEGATRFEVASKLTECVLAFIYGVGMMESKGNVKGVLQVQRTTWVTGLKAIGAELLDPRYQEDIKTFPYSAQELHEAVQAYCAMGNFPD